MANPGIGEQKESGVITWYQKDTTQRIQKCIMWIMITLKMTC